MGYIYKITNLINGKVYIGQTRRTVSERWKQHKKAAGATTNETYEYYLYRAMRKHGKENFSIETIEDAPDDLINAEEIFWIAYYDSINRNKGYNIATGGNGSSKITTEQVVESYKKHKNCRLVEEELHISRSTVYSHLREAVSEEEKRKNQYEGLKVTNGTPVYQYALSGEFIAEYPSYVYAANSVTTNPKGNASISQAANGFINAAYGYQWRKFKRDKIYPLDHWLGYKKVKQIDPDTKEVVAIYDSVFDAAKAINKCTGSIYQAIRHPCKSGGYNWEYV